VCVFEREREREREREIERERETGYVYVLYALYVCRLRTYVCMYAVILA
jgi:hypothetical protein